MIADYHIHTKASPDAEGEMKEYVRKAKEKGIDEIGFSDHILPQQVKGYPHMPIRFAPAYVRNFIDLERESELPLKLGVEIDFIAGCEEKVRELVKQYPLDYVIGSVHLIGDWAIDDRAQIHEYSKKGIMQVYEEYFDLTKKLCKSGLFNILGHPDLIKIFGFKPEGDFSRILADVAEMMAKSEICAEINTRGLRRPCQEMYPSETFLRMLYNHGVPITFGSDAHEPDDVGRDFGQALKLATKVGYTAACVFDQKEIDFAKF